MTPNAFSSPLSCLCVSISADHSSVAQLLLCEADDGEGRWQGHLRDGVVEHGAILEVATTY